MNGSVLVLALVNLPLANAIVRFAVAMASCYHRPDELLGVQDAAKASHRLLGHV